MKRFVLFLGVLLGLGLLAACGQDNRLTDDIQSEALGETIYPGACKKGVQLKNLYAAINAKLNPQEKVLARAVWSVTNKLGPYSAIRQVDSSKNAGFVWDYILEFHEGPYKTQVLARFKCDSLGRFQGILADPYPVVLKSKSDYLAVPKIKRIYTESAVNMFVYRMADVNGKTLQTQGSNQFLYAFNKKSGDIVLPKGIYSKSNPIDRVTYSINPQGGPPAVSDCPECVSEAKAYVTAWEVWNTALADYEQAKRNNERSKRKLKTNNAQLVVAADNAGTWCADVALTKQVKGVPTCYITLASLGHIGLSQWEAAQTKKEDQSTLVRYEKKYDASLGSLRKASNVYSDCVAANHLQCKE